MRGAPPLLLRLDEALELKPEGACVHSEEVGEMDGGIGAGGTGTKGLSGGEKGVGDALD